MENTLINNTLNEKVARLEHIDMMKGIAIFLVVMGHEIDYLNKSEIVTNIPAIVSYIARWIGFTHMPIFFVCAGIFADRYEKNTVGKNIVNAVFRLMIPYFLQIILLTLTNQLFSGIFGTKADWGRVLKSIYKPFGQYWFLYVLFLVEVFYCLCVHIIKKRMIRHLVIIMTGSVLYIFQMIWKVDYSLIENFMKYLVFFGIGIILSKYICDISHYIIPFIVVGLVLLGVSFIDNVPLIVCSLLSVDVLFVFSAFICNYIKPLKTGIQYLGKNSMEIYSIHPYINMIVRVLLARIWFNDLLFIRMLVSTLLIISICCLIIKFVLKDWIVLNLILGKYKFKNKTSNS